MSGFKAQTAEKLTQRPFAERQLLVVSTDAMLTAAERIEADKSTKKTQSHDWGGMALGALSAFGGWQASVGKILGIASIEAYKALMKAWDKGLPIQTISFEEAAQLDFPPGHPRIDTVYACHPANPAMYYPLADFHRVAFEDKFAEAMTLLMALGANTLRVEHVTGWSSDFAATAAAAVPGKMSISADAEKSSEKNNRLLFEASLTGRHDPMLPDHLIWYQHEPTWRSIATGRMSYGLDSFRLGITYRDDYGIDSKLTASIEGAGLGIGGKFEEHQSTVWQIEGTFQDRRN
jgi:hypothetical protein